MSAAVAERTELSVLSFEGARKLHIADPTDETRPLCGREGEATSCGTLAVVPADRLCKGCCAEVAALVRVLVPDEETVEVVERLVRRDHFRPETPAAVVSETFKERLLAGERPGLTWSGYEDPPVEPGTKIALTDSVTITVFKITRTKKGEHRGHYTVDDDRPALPRRVPAMYRPPEFDHLGLPIPHTKESIAAATIDGNYTQDPSQAVPGVAPEVDVEYRRVLGVRRRMKHSEAAREADPMKEAERDAERLNRELKELAKRAVKMGLDPVERIAPIQRAIEEAHAGLSEDKAAA